MDFLYRKILFKYFSLDNGSYFIYILNSAALTGRWRLFDMQHLLVKTWHMDAFFFM